MPVDPKALTNAVAYVSYAALSLHPSLRGKISLLLTALAEVQRERDEERQEHGAFIHDTDQQIEAVITRCKSAEARAQALTAERDALVAAAEWLHAPFDPAQTCGPIIPPDGAFVAGWREAWYTIGTKFRQALASPTPEPPKEV